MFKDELQYELAMMALESAIDEDIAALEAEEGEEMDIDVFESIGLDYLFEAEEGEKEDSKPGFKEKAKETGKKIAVAIKTFFATVKNWLKSIVTKFTEFVRGMRTKGLEKKLKAVKYVNITRKDKNTLDYLKEMSGFMMGALLQGIQGGDTTVGELEELQKKREELEVKANLSGKEDNTIERISGDAVMKYIALIDTALKTINSSIGKYENALIKLTANVESLDATKTLNTMRSETVKAYNSFMKMANKSLASVMSAVARAAKDEAKDPTDDDKVARDEKLANFKADRAEKAEAEKAEKKAAAKAAREAKKNAAKDEE